MTLIQDQNSKPIIAKNHMPLPAPLAITRQILIGIHNACKDHEDGKNFEWIPDAVRDPTESSVDAAYDRLVDDVECGEDTWLEFRDAFRESGHFKTDSDIAPPYSRHYESRSVARRLDDGSVVGWTYWYGGGKHSEPEAIEWISESYYVECQEELKVVAWRTFKKVDEPVKYEPVSVEGIDISRG